MSSLRDEHAQPRNRRGRGVAGLCLAGLLLCSHVAYADIVIPPDDPPSPAPPKAGCEADDDEADAALLGLGALLALAYFHARASRSTSRAGRATAMKVP